MRPDMHRVLVTRPRLGGQVRRKRRKHRFKDMPSHVGMKRTHAFAKADMKMLNEHLQPLRRYLHAQVGRPWDKVFATGRALRPRGSACGQEAAVVTARRLALGAD